jgi:hypothetical protein
MTADAILSRQSEFLVQAERDDRAGTIMTCDFPNRADEQQDAEIDEELRVHRRTSQRSLSTSARRRATRESVSCLREFTDVSTWPGSLSRSGACHVRRLAAGLGRARGTGASWSNALSTCRRRGVPPVGGRSEHGPALRSRKSGAAIPRREFVTRDP